MTKCPKCKKEIQTLNYYSCVPVSQTFSVKNGCADYTAFDDYGDHINEQYCCPECKIVLVRTEQDAVAFLTNKNRRR